MKKFKTLKTIATAFALGTIGVASIVSFTTSCATTNTLAISCSSSGNITTGATIIVDLLGGADWNKVSISDKINWNKSTSSHEFARKLDPLAKNDESVTVTLDGSDSHVSLVIPSGYTPDQSIHASVDGSLQVGSEQKSVTLTVEAVNDADLTGLYASCAGLSFTDFNGGETNRTATISLDETNPASSGDHTMTIGTSSGLETQCVITVLPVDAEKSVSAVISANNLNSAGTGEATLIVGTHNFDWGDGPTISGDNWSDFKSLSWTGNTNTRDAKISLEKATTHTSWYLTVSFAIEGSAEVTTNFTITAQNGPITLELEDFPTFPISGVHNSIWLPDQYFDAKIYDSGLLVQSGIGTSNIKIYDQDADLLTPSYSNGTFILTAKERPVNDTRIYLSAYYKGMYSEPVEVNYIGYTYTVKMSDDPYFNVVGATIGTGSGGGSQGKGFKDGMDEKFLELCFTSIIFPYGINTINENAFFGSFAFRNLDEPITIKFENPDLTTIGDHAFKGCAGIESVDFSLVTNSDISIGYEAFYGCTLQKVVGGYAITPFDAGGGTDFHAFRKVGTVFDYSSNHMWNPGIGCLAYGTFSPTTNKSIGYYAFQGCAGITNVDFSQISGGNIESIGRNAFDGCALTSVTPGNGVVAYSDSDSDPDLNNIDWGNAFHLFGIASLTPNYWSDDAGLWTDGFGCLTYGSFAPIVGGTAAYPIGKNAFLGCAGITSFDFSGVTTTGTFTIGQDAFLGCAGALRYIFAYSLTTFAPTDPCFGGCRLKGQVTGTTNVATMISNMIQCSEWSATYRKLWMSNTYWTP